MLCKSEDQDVVRGIKRTQESVESGGRGIKGTGRTTHGEQEQVSTTGTCYTGGCITPLPEWKVNMSICESRDQPGELEAH